jgi:Transglutaminase-like superfamily
MRVARTTRIAWVPTLWGMAYIVVGVAIATAIAWPIYETPRLAVIAFVGTALAVLLALLARRFALPWWAVTLLALVEYLVAVVPLAIPSALGTPLNVLLGVRDGVTAVVVGWKQLLTLTLPLQDYQAVLAPFLIVIFVSSLVAALLVVRGGTGSVAVVPLVLLMSAFGATFGSNATGAPLDVAGITIPAPLQLLLGIGLALASLLWLVGRSRINRMASLRAARAQTGSVRQGRESAGFAVRRNALAALIVIIAVVVGVGFAPVAASIQPRQALRNGVNPDLVVQQQPSPLSGYRGWFTASRFSAPLFTVSGKSDGVDRIQLATLEDYDGETFDVSGATNGKTGTFSHLPRTTPQGSGATPLTITIGSAYSGIWVPVPAGLAAAPTFLGQRAAQLSDDFYISTTDATAIDVATTASGTSGLRPGDSYRVYAGAVPDTANSLSGAAPGQSSINGADYPALVDWVKAQGEPRNAQGLGVLISRLMERGYLSHSLEKTAQSKAWIAALSSRSTYAFEASYAGHSVARVESLFTSLLNQQRTAGSHATRAQLVSGVGDDEQFATAAALLARYFGYDSRVVLGVRLGTAQPGLGVAPCQTVCRGANLSAWIQVAVPGGPWVTFDTTPQYAIAPTTVSQGEQLPSNPTIPSQTKSTVVQPPQSDRDNSDLRNARSSATPAWIAVALAILRVVGVSLLVLLLLLLPALVLLFAKAWRRRGRRDAPVPEVSLVGAWYELVDLYLDNGIALPRDGTPRQLAIASGRSAALHLATAVSSGVFGEHPPGRSASSAAWQTVDAERVELAQNATPWRRLMARVGLASFVRQLDPSSLVSSVFSRLLRKDRS